MEPIVVVFLIGVAAILIAGVKKAIDDKKRKYEFTDEDAENWLEYERLAKTEKTCNQCKESIKYFAKICPYCRSKQPFVMDPRKKFGGL